MSKQTILALDPGKSTGFIVCSVEDNLDSLFILAHGVLNHWRGVEELIDNHKPDVIVAEQYRLYPRMASVQAFSTVVAARVLGAIEYIAEKRGIPLFEQPAVQGKIFVPENVYTRLDKHTTPHEKDALRHAVSYCLRHGVNE